MKIDPKVLKELKEGTHSAFEAVFNCFSKQLFLFSLKHLKSEQAAEDVVQEVFLKI